jgi:predicted RNA binding protein YcfA (HicA-like mRNA interferase family)
MRVTWQELRDVCRLLGCVQSRVKGDHLIMTRPGLPRPIVIKMDRNISEDIVRSNMRTLGIDRAELERQLAIIRKR